MSERVNERYWRELVVLRYEVGSENGAPVNDDNLTVEAMDDETDILAASMLVL
jgi:hypothetical protein